MLIATILLSACLFVFGLWLGRRSSSLAYRSILTLLGIVLAIPGLLYIFYYAHWFDSTAWFISLCIVPYSELLAAGLGFLAGVIQSFFNVQSFATKLVVPVILLAAVFIPYLKSFLDPVDLRQMRTTCQGESCLQSAPSTCGPSSAASLLINYGLPASEWELARDSYTSNSGTEIWNLARALQKRGFLTRIEIQKPNAISPPGSSIAGVLLPGGAGHFIAVLDRRDDDFVVMDPLKGLIATSSWGLQQTYKFTGFFLLVHPSLPSRAAAISPQQVVEHYLAREMSGERFTPEGWRRVSACFIRPDAPPVRPNVYVMISDYSVWPPFFRNGIAEVIVGNYHAGDIDPVLRYIPPDPKYYKNGFAFKLDFVQNEGNSIPCEQSISSGHTPRWQIENAPWLLLDVPSAIRYVVANRAQTNDPAIIRNADQTLAHLRAIHNRK